MTSEAVAAAYGEVTCKSEPSDSVPFGSNSTRTRVMKSGKRSKGKEVFVDA